MQRNAPTDLLVFGVWCSPRDRCHGDEMAPQAKWRKESWEQGQGLDLSPHFVTVYALGKRRHREASTTPEKPGTITWLRATFCLEDDIVYLWLTGRSHKLLDISSWVLPLLGWTGKSKSLREQP